MFSSTEAVLAPTSATARSGCPSPLRSPTATERGAFPVGYATAGAKTAVAADAEPGPDTSPITGRRNARSSRARGLASRRRAPTPSISNFVTFSSLLITHSRWPQAARTSPVSHGGPGGYGPAGTGPQAMVRGAGDAGTAGARPLTSSSACWSSLRAMPAAAGGPLMTPAIRRPAARSRLRGPCCRSSGLVRRGRADL